jgi:hypothetical protein
MLEPTAAKPTEQPHPWSSDALLSKAQKYAEAMVEHTKDDWRFGLWSSLVLELLLRAALAKVSPALLADKGDWNNVYYALGHTPMGSKFVPKSIPVLEVAHRLESVYKEFTPEVKNACIKRMTARNEELHTAGAPFHGVGTSSWLPAFYEGCEVLLGILGTDLVYLFGRDEAAVASEMIRASKDESAKSIRKTIEEHKNAWEALRDGDRSKLSIQAVVWAARHEGHRVKCPACGRAALVTGSAAGLPRRTFAGDQITVRQEFLPAKFECVACSLKITGLSHLTAAGLGDGFTATNVYDADEFYSEEPEFEPDFNET